jgi:hypothetical protein
MGIVEGAERRDEELSVGGLVHQERIDESIPAQL